MTQIEILSLYLPHNLEVECEWVNYRAFLHGIESDGDCCIKIFKVVDDDLIHDGNYYWPAEDVKPHLYPLSMITEEIEHEGKKVELLSLLDYERQSSLNRFKNKFAENIKVKSYETLCFKQIQFCLKYHLDVFGLIDQGKAIDKTGL